MNNSVLLSGRMCALGHLDEQHCVISGRICALGHLDEQQCVIKWSNMCTRTLR